MHLYIFLYPDRIAVTFTHNLFFHINQETLSTMLRMLRELIVKGLVELTPTTTETPGFAFYLTPKGYDNVNLSS